MSRIKISPEQVRQLSGQFKQASQESQQIFNNLSSSVNNIQGEWEGVTQQRFFQEYEQWKTSMSQFVQLLDSIGAQLDTVAARFENVDSGG
ncbi:MAG TPA: WXG100 family type VII secretion target [Chloroflexia bacterium]|jgi:WXG100 family type VII secretion target|nr:WXG100 family type VII secretion target [Chloroflexia bacterium]HET6313921.1 WXG100 family type VII secretion target [Chloroflexia bacterium]